MSDTNKKTNAAIACGDFKVDDKKLILEQENYGPSRKDINKLAGLEIPFGEEKICKIETCPNGIIKVNGVKIKLDENNNGTLNNKGKAIDKGTQR